MGQGATIPDFRLRDLQNAMRQYLLSLHATVHSKCAHSHSRDERSLIQLIAKILKHLFELFLADGNLNNPSHSRFLLMEI
jgi:hypothetical protein